MITILDEARKNIIPQDKYTRFISKYRNEANSLLMSFLKDTKRDIRDYMPMSKGHMNYIRWYRTYDNERQGYFNIMRDGSKPLINFQFLNDLIHLFYFAGQNDKTDELNTYGHYDYNHKTGKLRYLIDYVKQYHRNPDGSPKTDNNHPWRIKGTGHNILSTVKSPEGRYSPRHGIHPDMKKFGYMWNRYFEPEANMFNAQNQITGTTHMKGFQFPVSGEEDIDTQLHAFGQSVFKNFHNAKSRALFLAFLIASKQDKFDAFTLWQQSNFKYDNSWRSVIISQAESIINQNEEPNPQYNIKPTPQQHSPIPKANQTIRDPQPDNRRTREDFLTPEQWDELYNESIKNKLNNIISEAIDKIFKENLLKN